LRYAGIARDLTLAALAPQLHRGFVQETEAVQTAGGELPAVRIEGEFSLQRDAAAALDERARLALAAEAESLEPTHRDEAEAVVEFGDVDIPRPEIAAPPHHAGGVAQRHGGEVVELVPGRAAV